MKRIILRLLLIGTFITLGVSCSTKKNTIVNRNFHSITTKYNGFFNARESYNAGVKKLEQLHEDNFEDVLSIFRYGSKQQASSVAGDMETAYQKASTAIRRHSMNIKGVEYNRWIDDSYFLIAGSHYFKGDYNLAILTFQYIIRQYESPLKYLSMIWIAKAQVRAGDYFNAQQTLERLSRDLGNGNFTTEARLFYNMVYADLFLQQKNYRQAAPYLTKAAELAPNKKLRTRLIYILAQSYQQDQNFRMAQQTYARVLKLRPDYQMAFQTRINMAMAFDPATGDSNFILSELQGMLRNNHNKEFRDQIYYALGQFSMRQNNESKAIEYYTTGLENFKGNKSQRGILFLRMAEISLNNKQYLNAADQLDSTMLYLSREYPAYTQASNQHSILKDLALNMRRIQREDSLQRLALMPPEQRNAVLDQIIEKIEEEERLEKQREQERTLMRQQMMRSGRNQAMGAGGEGGWYFYNPSAISFGRNEFYAKWGERELQDLWRISNKRIISFGETATSGQEQSMSENSDGKVSRASLIQNIPTTPEKMEESKEKVALSHYNIGVIFKDRFNDPSSAISSFETLINNHPSHHNRLLGAYFLYLLHQQSNNIPRADIYKNLIIREFPETDFALILSDPSYRQKIAERENRFQSIYSSAYLAFSSGDYNKASNLINQGLTDTTDLNRNLAARFKFLKALIFARTNQNEALINQLTLIRDNYKETEVHQPAMNLLAFLGTSGMLTASNIASVNGQQQLNGAAARPVTLPPGAAVFSNKPNSVHFYVFVVNTRNVQLRVIRNEINTFNRDAFADNSLNMSTLFFDQNRQLLTITNFPDAAKAMDYGARLNALLLDKDFDPSAYESFAISVDNYPVFYQERKLDDYLEFFRFWY